MYITPDGSDTSRVTNTIVLTPAGTIRVVVAFFRYRETVGSDALTQWMHAQEQINADHREFANSRGYTAPIVVFKNTNLVIDPLDVSALDPFDAQSVRRAVRDRGYAARDYDLLISIDMNPARFAGGRSFNAQRFIHVGNYFHRTTLLTARDWNFVAMTAYHHEVAHQWGWPGTHDWDRRCETTAPHAFIVAPVLFGWEDVDGDRIPEILDPTPYGAR